MIILFFSFHIIFFSFVLYEYIYYSTISYALLSGIELPCTQNVCVCTEERGVHNVYSVIHECGYVVQ